MSVEVTAQSLARLTMEDRQAVLDTLSSRDAFALLYDWYFWARSDQLPPDGDWFCWLVLAGRGFGKTRMGAEWVRAKVMRGLAGRIALVGDTLDDVRHVMVEGESGLLGCSPPDYRPVLEISKRRLIWPNGAQARLFSAADPEQLRGPQHDLAWADEIAKWSSGETAWQNLTMGLRLGTDPRVLATTTPRPLAWLKSLMEASSTAVTRGATMDNRAHLSPRFLAEMERAYGGTRIGRQELSGDYLEDGEGALWSRGLIEENRAAPPESFTRLVVAVDPPVSQGPDADTCGIIAAGLGENSMVYVLEDGSMQGLSPAGWMAKALVLYERLQADRLVAEVNNGGDLVETLARQIKPDVSYRAVRATRGKLTRAEPVAALYEQGRVKHVKPFPALEDEMCRYNGTGSSPDRLDALVWAVTDLALSQGQGPRIRGL